MHLLKPKGKAENAPTVDELIRNLPCLDKGGHATNEWTETMKAKLKGATTNHVETLAGRKDYNSLGIIAAYERATHVAMSAVKHLAYARQWEWLAEVALAREKPTIVEFAVDALFVAKRFGELGAVRENAVNTATKILAAKRLDEATVEDAWNAGTGSLYALERWGKREVQEAVRAVLDAENAKLEKKNARKRATEFRAALIEFEARVNATGVRMAHDEAVSCLMKIRNCEFGKFTVKELDVLAKLRAYHALGEAVFFGDGWCKTLATRKLREATPADADAIAKEGRRADVDALCRYGSPGTREHADEVFVRMVSGTKRARGVMFGYGGTPADG